MPANLTMCPGFFSFACGYGAGRWSRSLLANSGPMDYMAGGQNMVVPNVKRFQSVVVGHWPAGNVEIQPILSMTCSLLGGNAALVRIPSGLVELTQQLMEKLVKVIRTNC